MPRVILTKVADGELTTEEGNAWMDLIDRAVKSDDVLALCEKTEFLEKRLNEQRHVI